MFVFCFVIPFPIPCSSKRETVVGTTIASISVIICMWLERFTIVVPTLASLWLATGNIAYSPTLGEWSVLAGFVSFFILLYMVFTKLFPIVSIWEVQEGKGQ